MEDGTLTAETALLERALGYALCALRPVTSRTLNHPTPCRSWDLRTLLWHTHDSLCALCEGIEDGYVEVPSAAQAADAGPRAEAADAAAAEARANAAPEPHAPADAHENHRDDPAAAVRSTASRLLGAWAAAGSGCDRVVAVADLPITAAAVARAGALEIAVHGWDIARATGLPRPVPAALANELIRTARQLVPTPALRFPLFGPPLTVPAEADPSDRLVAFLGRDPHWQADGPRHRTGSRPAPPPETPSPPPLTP
ncbi:maleylpyruvate isomerase family mycothiol-dependent enzyme [Streptomyces ovatisporus]|uniref:Maleylpyruvate isomerase family mycothiol-dependent enzyme n=1 Tax=Streptomyces ovatisporus TaxID=1128682 RepID=A0ABV9A5K6_9ACTN